jgi:rhomboid protease GluP
MAKCIRCGRQLPAFSFKKICQWCQLHEAEQRGEVPDEARQRVMPAPWVRRESGITLTRVIFGANLAVFLGMQLASGPTADFSGQELVHWGSNYGPYTLSGDWWRLFTYMFLHGGVMHIAFNMWCLWDLGALCESLYGPWTYAGVYLITGVAGGLASVAWNPGVLSVGASGAIFGLAGALIASFYLGEFSVPRVGLRPILTSLLVFAGFNLFFGSLFPGIDNACHVGGLVSGLILGALIARIAPHHDAPLRRVGVLTVVAFGLVGCAFGVRQWRGTPFRIGRAMQSFSENDPNRGIAQLQAIVKQQPKFVQARYALAQAYFSKDRLAEAEAEFKQVLQLQPDHTNARFQLGLVYLSEKRPEEAKTTFSQLLAQDSNNGEAHYGIGLALADEGKNQAAIDEFKTAIRLNAPYSGIYYEMGQSYARLKMYDDAITSYLESQKKDGDDVDLEAALADAYQAKGMTQQAQEARAKAEQLKNANLPNR